MAITFTSKASGDVTMLDANAQEMLDIIGKAMGPRGVITAVEVSNCLALLRAALSAQAKPADDDADDVPAMQKRVPLATRAFPLIELLEKSRAKGADVLWGV